MRCCDALVLPSHSEGIPGVIKEAGLMGLPVIATRVGGIPEIVDEQTASLVEVNDVAGLRQKIEWHLQHTQEAAAKAQHLKQQLEGKFDADRIATVLAAKYRELTRRS
jgi:glycosyltransferase involved in cell wall biosynthesis